jgi:hypothetical protein
MRRLIRRVGTTAMVTGATRGVRARGVVLNGSAALVG